MSKSSVEPQLQLSFCPVSHENLGLCLLKNGGEDEGGENSLEKKVRKEMARPIVSYPS